MRSAPQILDTRGKKTMVLLRTRPGCRTPENQHKTLAKMTQNCSERSDTRAVQVSHVAFNNARDNKEQAVQKLGFCSRSAQHNDANES